MQLFRRRNAGTIAALLTAALVAAACSIDRAPTRVSSSGPARLANVGVSPQEEAALKAWEIEEKHRVFLAAERSRPVYDSLKTEWERFLKNEQSYAGLLFCDPLQYASEVKIVGPEGGDLSIGPHKLRIPPGALRRSVVITGEMPVSLVVGVELSPHGLVFAKSVELELSYKHCSVPTNFDKFLVYHVGQQILEFPSSTDAPSDGLVRGPIGHFSGYAIAHSR